LHASLNHRANVLLLFFLRPACIERQNVEIQTQILHPAASDAMIFKNIFAKKFDENIGIFCSNYCRFSPKHFHNIGF
jgi:hypothetical protein